MSSEGNNFLFVVGFPLRPDFTVGGLKTLSNPIGLKRSPPAFSLRTLLFHSGVPWASFSFTGEDLCWTVSCGPGAKDPEEARLPRSLIDAGLSLWGLTCPFGSRLCDALRFEAVFSLRAGSLLSLLRIEFICRGLSPLAVDKFDTNRGL